MKYGRYGWSYVFLSWGLGIPFLWIGLDILQHPTTWIGYIPADLPIAISREQALQFNGMFDIALGIILILQWWPKLAAFLAFLHLAAILATQGINAVLIRDVGLLGVALALLVWPTHYRRKHWWNPFGKKRPAEMEEE